jgi:hypothetical protein
MKHLLTFHHALIEIAAFGRSTEAELVDGLRADHDLVFSLVAADDDAIIGHAMFSKMNAPISRSWARSHRGSTSQTTHRRRNPVDSRRTGQGYSRRMASRLRRGCSCLLPAYRLRCQQNHRLPITLCWAAFHGVSTRCRRSPNSNRYHRLSTCFRKSCAGLISRSAVVRLLVVGARSKCHSNAAARSGREILNRVARRTRKLWHTTPRSWRRCVP